MRAMTRPRLLSLLLPLLLAHCAPPLPPGVPTQSLPRQWCYVDSVAPTVRTELKYAGSDNFVGRPIAGYTGRRAVLRRDAAEALARASAELEKKGLGLLIWDAYRPSRALRDFYAWSKTADESTRAEFYPNITKQGIYEGRYIGLTSEHTWGIAVDVTLLDLRTGRELDMGGRHDLLDASSATDYAGITPRQRANRRLLCDTMERAGFRNYSKEWWHYFLRGAQPCYVYDFPLDDNMAEQEAVEKK